MPCWPGRNEIVFVAAGDLEAFDYVANSTRAVGRLDSTSAPLGFDALGNVLLAVRLTEPGYGTVTVAEGRLTSALRPIPVAFGSRPLGLVRIK
jgi:hypothetical protein